MTLAESTILVVDDEPVLRQTFSFLLQSTGARVLCAGDGVEALQVVAASHADLILTDKQMPRMDGVRMLHQMRANGVQVPAILFVSGVLPESAEEMERLHVVETIMKPIHPTALIEILQRVLQPLHALS